MGVTSGAEHLICSTRPPGPTLLCGRVLSNVWDESYSPSPPVLMTVIRRVSYCFRLDNEAWARNRSLQPITGVLLNPVCSIAQSHISSHIVDTSQILYRPTMTTFPIDFCTLLSTLVSAFCPFCYGNPSVHRWEILLCEWKRQWFPFLKCTALVRKRILLWHFIENQSKFVGGGTVPKCWVTSHCPLLCVGTHLC